MSEILKVISEYDFNSPVDTIESIDIGNINKTYKLTTCDGQKYILQKINNSVFCDVEKLMWNIEKTTEKLNIVKRQKTLDKMCVINIKFTRQGKSYCCVDGKFYRIYDYMPNSVTFESNGGLDRIYSAGEAFGLFASCLADERIFLYDIMPGFHNTCNRLAHLTQAFNLSNNYRQQKASELYEYFVSHNNYVKQVQADIESLPKRIVHNDTKLSNVAFNAKTGEALGVLDLDTIGYGSFVYDFGDGARSFAGPYDEDESDLSVVEFNIERFTAFSDGYLGQLKNIITKDELKLLPHGVSIITLELGVRFLTDFLNNDKYFKIDYKEQNFFRARCMATLHKDIVNKFAEIKKVAQISQK